MWPIGLLFLIQSKITEAYLFINSLEKEQEKNEQLTHQNQEKEDKLTDMRLKYMRYFLSILFAIEFHKNVLYFFCRS